MERVALKPQTKIQRLWKQVVKHKMIYLMLLPVALYFIVFSYYPLALGIIKSFQKSKMIGTPEFVALANYATVLQDIRYMEALKNTLIVGIGTFLLQFIMGLVIALCLNEVKNKVAKSLVQTFTYIPNLLSWSVVAGMWLAMLSANGMVNGFLDATGLVPDSKTIFMGELSFTYYIYIFTAAWKGAGYYAVLFLAAIVSIDPSIYEAASIDGASRSRQIMRITIPNLVPTMKVITVLAAMSILRNFDQVLVMYNTVTQSKSRSLLFLIYTEGIQKFQVGTATAAATMLLLVTMVISYIVRRATKYDENY